MRVHNNVPFDVSFSRAITPVYHSSQSGVESCPIDQSAFTNHISLFATAIVQRRPKEDVLYQAVLFQFLVFFLKVENA